MDQHVSESEIDRYLEDTASESARTRLHDHLAACAACAESWREIIAAHDALSDHRFDVPEGLIDQQVARVAVSASHERDGVRRTILRAAALLLAASLGAAIGRAVPRAGTAPASGNYLLLLSGSRASQMSETEVRTIGRAFAQWTDSLRQIGRLDTQSQLERSTLAPITSDSAASVTATASALAMVEGFFLIRASDDADAVAVARSSPYLQYGGSITVRKRRALGGTPSVTGAR